MAEESEERAVEYYVTLRSKDGQETEVMGNVQSSNRVKMETKDPDDKSPGFGMKMVIFSMAKKFPSVKQLSTNVLGKWMKCSAQTTAVEDDAELCKIQNEDTVDSNLIILDCRPEEEYIVSHIPGALRVDYDNDTSKIVEVVPQLNSGNEKKTIVCYCSLGYRSCVVAQKLDQYYNSKTGDSSSVEPMSPNVYNLAGSLFKWANEGRSMQDLDNKTTVYAHPFTPMWSKFLDKNLRREHP
ncbi:hypothetical protein ScPMuIL_005422 [Solemya velum]